MQNNDNEVPDPSLVPSAVSPMKWLTIFVEFHEKVVRAVDDAGMMTR